MAFGDLLHPAYSRRDECSIVAAHVLLQSEELKNGRDDQHTVGQCTIIRLDLVVHLDNLTPASYHDKLAPYVHFFT